MMDKQVTLTLFDEGIMSALYKAGFIGPKVFEYRDIYMWVDVQIKVRGISKTQAALEAEVKFNKGRTAIWRALKSFE